MTVLVLYKHACIHILSYPIFIPASSLKRLNNLPKVTQLVVADPGFDLQPAQTRVTQVCCLPCWSQDPSLESGNPAPGHGMGSATVLSPVALATLCWDSSAPWRYDDEGENDIDSLLALLPGFRGPHRHPSSAPAQSCCLYAAWGAVTAALGRGKWGQLGPRCQLPGSARPGQDHPEGSLLVGSVVTSPAGEAPGVPDTQSTILGTNLETGKQIKLK